MSERMRNVEDTREHTVYRLFDADGVLLYIGMTVNDGMRHLHHTSPTINTAWGHFIATSTTEDYPNRVEAHAAEIAAIKAERPIFNKHHNPDKGARAEAYKAAHLPPAHEVAAARALMAELFGVSP